MCYNTFVTQKQKIMSEIPTGQGPSSPEAKHPNLTNPNVEALRQAGEVGEHFARLYQRATDLYPELSGVTIYPMDQERVPSLAHTGGMARHQSYSEAGKPEIMVNTGDGWEHYAKLIKKRPISARLSAEKAGINPDAITPKQLASFVFLHELGHAKHFLESPDFNAYKEDVARELKSLPIAGYNPAQLIAFLNSDGGRRYMVDNATLLSARGIHTANDLVYAQEAAYRRIHSEDYPDRFAAHVLAYI